MAVTDRLGRSVSIDDGSEGATADEVDATSYVLGEDDDGHTLIFTHEDGCTVTFSNSLLQGWRCFIIQEGGTVTISGADCLFIDHTGTAGVNAGVTLYVKRNTTGSNADLVMFGATA